MNFARIDEIARRLDTCAVIGGYALIAHGYMRFTRDFDLLTTDRNALQPEMWDRERADGMKVEIHRGDFDDPLTGAVRIRSRVLNLDVVVAKYKWQGAVIERASLMQFKEFEFRVPRVSDLIVLKVDADSVLDKHDAIELLKRGPRHELLRELQEIMPTLPDPLQRRLTDFLAQNNSSMG